MIEITQNNHLKFEYDCNKPFWVKFGHSTNPVLSFKEEVLKTVKCIIDKVDKPIWVCYSGGIDSEVIVRSFMELNHPIHILIIEYSEDMNKHDIVNAINFCEENNLKYKKITMDMKQFLVDLRNSEHPYRKYNNSATYRYMQIKMIEEISKRGGYPIIGSGEQKYETDSKNNLIIKLGTDIFTPARYCIDNKINACPYFFWYRPELIHSFCIEPEVQMMYSENIKINSRAHNVKEMVYHKYWPNMKKRTKYHGYEMVFNEKTYTERILQLSYANTLQLIYLTPEIIMEQTKYIKE